MGTELLAPDDEAPGAAGEGPSWAGMPLGATHWSSTTGQSGALGGTAAVALFAGLADAECQAAGVMCSVIGAAMGIDMPMAIAGRASPVRQANSAHTSSTPDQVRSGRGGWLGMRAMLGHRSSASARP